jgi:hypothetical protein
VDQYLESNRELWNEWTAIHERSEFYDLDSFKRGGHRLRDYDLQEVGEVEGKVTVAPPVHPAFLLLARPETVTEAVPWTP